MRILLLTSTALLLASLGSACGAPLATTPTLAPSVPPQATASAAATPWPSAAPLARPAEVVSMLTIKLQPGLRWSDGSDLTAQDVVGTYDLLWAQGDTSWAGLHDVIARDATTVEFQLTQVSPGLLRALLRTNQPAPRAQYAALMDRAHALRTGGASPQDQPVAQLLDELMTLQPAVPLSYGPFAIDPAAITEAQLELIKQPGGFHADRIPFERVVVYYGEVAESTPLVLAGQLDYSTHAYPPAAVAAFAQRPNIAIIRSPTGTGPAIWFNQSVYPLDRQQLRQAVAYAIDRAEVAAVALGEAGRPVEHMAGFSDLLVPRWLPLATRSQLNPYRHDRQRAVALLNELGFVRGADGSWYDDRGAPLAFELSVPADFADWLGAAENVAQQLSAFGIRTSVRGYPSAERAAVLREARYQLLIDFGMLTTPPHPATAYSFYMTDALFNANNPAAEAGPKGLNWPWQQQTPDGSSIDVRAYIAQSTVGVDIEAQQQYIATLAQIYNQQLPVVALFERYTNDPIDTKTRVTGWLPPSDPIYQNNQGGDNYVAIQLLDGTLQVAPGGDRTFRTSYPYPQPPNASFNLFALNSLQQQLGYPAQPILFPPFFWYMEASGSYVPGIAESYQLVALQ